MKYLKLFSSLTLLNGVASSGGALHSLLDDAKSGLDKVIEKYDEYKEKKDEA